MRPSRAARMSATRAARSTTGWSPRSSTCPWRDLFGTRRAAYPHRLSDLPSAYTVTTHAVNATQIAEDVGIVHVMELVFVRHQVSCCPCSPRILAANIPFFPELTNPDLVQFAASFGAKGYKVEKTEDLIPTLKQAIADNTVAIVDCPQAQQQSRKFIPTIIVCKTTDWIIDGW